MRASWKRWHLDRALIGTIRLWTDKGKTVAEVREWRKEQTFITLAQSKPGGIMRFHWKNYG